MKTPKEPVNHYPDGMPPFESIELAEPLTLDGFRNGERVWVQIMYDAGHEIQTAHGHATMVHITDEQVAYSVICPAGRLQYIGVEFDIPNLPASSEILIPFHRVYRVDASTEEIALFCVARSTMDAGMSEVAQGALRARITRMLELGL